MFKKWAGVARLERVALNHYERLQPACLTFSWGVFFFVILKLEKIIELKGVKQTISKS